MSSTVTSYMIWKASLSPAGVDSLRRWVHFSLFASGRRQRELLGREPESSLYARAALRNGPCVTKSQERRAAFLRLVLKLAVVAEGERVQRQPGALRLGPERQQEHQNYRTGGVGNRRERLQRFNHSNFANPVNFLGAPNLGQVTLQAVPPTSSFGSFLAGAPSNRILPFQGKIVF